MDDHYLMVLSQMHIGSIMVAPRAIAFRKDAKVFSGAYPIAPRWATTSKPADSPFHPTLSLRQMLHKRNIRWHSGYPAEL